MSKPRINIRKTLNEAIIDPDVADAILDAITDLQTSVNELNKKLDSDVGVSDTDFESSLSVSILDVD